MKKTVFLRTFGCQMNARDSEVICGLLRAKSYELTTNQNEADIVLFNTCSVRQHAEDKVWSAIGQFTRHQKNQNTKNKELRATSYELKRPIIGIIGCMAQSYKDEIFRRAPAVDIVCGPSCIDELPKLINAVTKSPSHQVTSQKQKNKTCLKVDEKTRPDKIYHLGFREKKDHAYVVISEGCDNYCSYCVVPYARGRLRHRPASAIIREIKAAVAAGVRDVTLLGQNVNSYDSVERIAYSVEKKNKKIEKVNFVGLLKKISAIKDIKTLSFMTSHPKDTTRELLEAIRDIPMMRKYLHVPVQSGSDRILKAMNRGYTVKKYLETVDDYRQIVYNGQLSTDIIVGFPGETKEDFEATRSLMERVGFDTAYIFKYSPRPHTKAKDMADDVLRLEKERRHAILLELQRKISSQKKKTKIE